MVVDLKRMNRVIEVNEANAFALVEPGVSYFDLYRHIQERKLKVWIDCPDPGWGSVVGNALDRGGGYTTAQLPQPLRFALRYGDWCCRTGSCCAPAWAPSPTPQTWQQYKTGCGPWIDGIFSQSNFGIVTKMGFWLMPEPEGVPARHSVTDSLHATSDPWWRSSITWRTRGSLPGFQILPRR